MSSTDRSSRLGCLAGQGKRVPGRRSAVSHGFRFALAILTLGLGAASSLPAIERWDKSFGEDTNTEHGHCVAQTRDGGYIVGADKRWQAWCLRLDENGDTVWSWKLPPTHNGSYIKAVAITGDGGYVFAGAFTTPTTPCTAAVLLFKLNDQGELVWNRRYEGESLGMHANAMVVLPDGGFVLAGCYDDWHVPYMGALALRTDSQGRELWRHTDESDLWPLFNAARQTQDGGFIFAGERKLYASGERYAWLYRTDSAGNEIWSRTYGGMRGNTFHAVEQTPDGGFAAAGATASFGAGRADCYLVRTDSLGRQLWQRTYGTSNTESCLGMRRTLDGGFILAGQYFDGGSSGYLVKTDSGGRAEWTRVFSWGHEDMFEDVALASDSGFVLTGYTYRPGGADNVWVAKTDASGSAALAEPAASTGPVRGPDLRASPNGRVSYTLHRLGNVRLRVYDPSGRRIAEMHTGIQEPGEHQLVLPTLTTGLYFLRLTSADGVSVTPFVETR